MNYQISVKERRITCDATEAVEKAIGVDTMTLLLDQEWDAMETVTVVLHNANADVSKQVPWLKSPIEVPWEVLDTPGRVYVSVVGYIGQEKRITTYRMEVPIVVGESGRVMGQDPTQSSPDVVQYLMDVVKSTAAGEEGRKTAFEAAQTQRKTAFDAAMTEWGGRVDLAASTANGAAAKAESASATANASASAADAATEKANNAAREVADALRNLKNIPKGAKTGAVCSIDDAFPAPLLAASVYGMTTTGKNLWPFAASYTSRLGKYTEFVADKTPLALPAGTYTFSCTGTFGDGDAPLWLYHDDGTKTMAFRIAPNVRNGVFTFTLDKPAVSCLFCCNACKTACGTVSRIQIERGRSATRYEPYAQKNPSSVKRVSLRVSGADASNASETPINLGGRELRGVSATVRDEARIDAAGNASLAVRIGRTTGEEIAAKLKLLNPGGAGTLPYVSTQTLPQYASYDDYAAKGSNVCISDKYKSVANTKEHGCYRTWNSVIVADERFTSLEEAKRILREDNAEFIASIPEQTTPIGKVAVPSLQEAVSNVWADADVDTECSVGYVRDITIALDKIEQQAASFASMIASLDKPTVIPELEV